MKRILAAVLAVLLLTPAASAGAFDPPKLSAASAILVDGESGRVLFEKDAHTQRPIASITKLMTALAAVERAADLTAEVTIRPEWTGIEGSSIYLRAGEIIPLETLLYGLLMNSGNDAAAAIAGYCAGDMETFVSWMNERAAQLGMIHTHFTNPSGLSEEGHYSTAYDMALLARACLENETVAKIVSTKSITLGTRTFINHNKLLWRYEGCTGMKTGYTEKSGRTLVSSAQRDGQTLIVVTLNAPGDWADHTALFDYGFAGFPRQELCAAGAEMAGLPVAGGLTRFVTAVTAEGVYYPLSAGEQVTSKVTLPDVVEAPVAEGTVLGKLSFYRGETLVGETDLVAGSGVHRDAAARRGFLGRLWDRLRGV